MKNIGKLSKYLLSLLLLVSITSCRDEDIVIGSTENQVPEEITKGFSLQFTVTLDNMGGDDYMTRADDLFNMQARELREVENYINPEMFRVLFFDEDDYFLFESKSRWVTQKEEIDGGNLWHVSVPVFSYGNDDPDYDWTKIRKSLMTGKFRIALLVNRPTWVYYPDFSDIKTGGGYFYYNYPNWDHKDSYEKKIFDLHHCAYDNIFTGKNNKNDVKNSVDGENVKGFYDFVFKNPDYTHSLKDESKNLMGAVYLCIDKVSETVDSMAGNDPKRKIDLNLSIPKLPTKDYPIPMYGVQVFDPLTDWVEGTTYNLSKLEGMYTNYEPKNISLLRSLVRCELLVPKSLGKKPTLVAFKYGNIYARTEPMDVSTPTNELWESDHANCEDELIRNYGAININSKQRDIKSAEGLQNFWDYSSWFYAIWQTMYNWNWNGKVSKSVSNSYVKENEGERKYPHIFNPMAQRNKIVYLANKTGVYTLANSSNDYTNVGWAKSETAKGDFALVEDNEYYRYVYYTGERAINDQSNLASSYNTSSSNWSSGTPREVNLAYWVVSFDDPFDIQSYTEKGSASSSNTYYNEHIRGYEYGHYCLPIIDYSDPGNNPFFKQKWNQGGSTQYTEITYPGRIPFRRTNDEPMQANTLKNYMDYIRDGKVDSKYLPYPLLRNHVYRLIIRSIGDENTNDKLDVITVDSEHRYSPTITFK